MTEPRAEYLTVRELAALLRVKDRAVYAMAAAGEIPCSRATGKLLFPRAAVDAWLARHSTGGLSTASPETVPAVVAGSHDPLLEWALRESRAGLATFFDGSLDGLKRLGEGQAVAAGIHLPEPPAGAKTREGTGDGPGGSSGGWPGDWNLRHVRDALPGAPVVVLEWAWRERGLILAADNPLTVRSIAGLAGRRVMPRQIEAGSQQLFLHLLRQAGLSEADLALFDPPARSELDVALAVADGRADAGFGLLGLARAFRLAFVPVCRERYDLIVVRRAYFDPPLQTFMSFCRSAAFARKAAEIGGYDLSGFGRVHYNGG